MTRSDAFNLVIGGRAVVDHHRSPRILCQQDVCYTTTCRYVIIDLT